VLGLPYFDPHVEPTGRTTDAMAGICRKSMCNGHRIIRDGHAIDQQYRRVPIEVTDSGHIYSRSSSNAP
jgi:hypothetical protein